MKNALKYVITILAVLLGIWLVNMIACNDEPASTPVLESPALKVKVDKGRDSLQVIIDSLENKIEVIDAELAAVDGTLTDRRDKYDEFNQKITDSDADTAFNYIIAFLDSTERGEDLQFHIDTSKANSDSASLGRATSP